jgi:hypothetical protein
MYPRFTLIRFCIIALVLVLSGQSSRAQWQQVFTHPDTTFAVHEFKSIGGRLLARTTHGIYYSDTYGTSWEPMVNERGGRNIAVTANILYVDENILYMLDNSIIYTSPDRGQTWDSIGGVIADGGVPVEYISHFFRLGPERIFTVKGGSNILYQAKDLYGPWHKTGNSTTASLELDATKNALYALGTVTDISWISKSEDGGATWKRLWTYADNLLHFDLPLKTIRHKVYAKVAGDGLFRYDEKDESKLIGLGVDDVGYYYLCDEFNDKLIIMGSLPPAYDKRRLLAVAIRQDGYTDLTANLPDLKYRPHVYDDVKVLGKYLFATTGTQGIWRRSLEEIGEIYSTTPASLNPPSGTVLSTNEVTLEWSTVLYSIGYHVQVSDTPDFSSGLIINDSTCNATQKKISGLELGKKYYWRVRGIFGEEKAVRKSGEEDVLSSPTWSHTLSFTTGNVMDVAEFSPVDHLPVIFPNPASGNASIQMLLKTPAHVAISLFDIRGEKVSLITDSEFGEGRREIAFKTAAYTPGSYFLKIDIAGKIYWQPLIIQR